MSGAKQRKRIAILGSTGSVGVNTLDLVERHPERYDVVALTAHSNYQALAAQAMRLNPEVVAIAEVCVTLQVAVEPGSGPRL